MIDPLLDDRSAMIDPRSKKSGPRSKKSGPGSKKNGLGSKEGVEPKCLFLSTIPFHIYTAVGTHPLIKLLPKSYNVKTSYI